MLPKAKILHAHLMEKFVCQDQLDADDTHYQAEHQRVVREIFQELDALCRTNWMAMSGGSHYVSVAEIQMIKAKYLGEDNVAK